MSVRPASAAILVCDGCGKEIKSGASTISGRLMTFLRIDNVDNTPLFTGRADELRQYHVWCVGVGTDPGAVWP